MIDKSTILGYAIALLLPAAVMYGTGYNGIVDALIFTMVWILLVVGILTTIIITLAGVTITITDLGDKIPSNIKAHMKTCKVQLNRWWIRIMLVAWMLVALASVSWTATAVTYFLIALASQTTSRFFVNTYDSLEEKLAVSNAN